MNKGYILKEEIKYVGKIFEIGEIRAEFSKLGNDFRNRGNSCRIFEIGEIRAEFSKSGNDSKYIIIFLN